MRMRTIMAAIISIGLLGVAHAQTPTQTYGNWSRFLSVDVPTFVTTKTDGITALRRYRESACSAVGVKPVDCSTAYTQAIKRLMDERKRIIALDERQEDVKLSDQEVADWSAAYNKANEQTGVIITKLLKVYPPHEKLSSTNGSR